MHGLVILDVVCLQVNLANGLVLYAFLRAVALTVESGWDRVGVKVLCDVRRLGREAIRVHAPLRSVERGARLGLAELGSLAASEGGHSPGGATLKVLFSKVAMELAVKFCTDLRR